MSNARYAAAVAALAAATPIAAGHARQAAPPAPDPLKDLTGKVR